MARHRVEIELDAVGRGTVKIDGRRVAARDVEIRTALDRCTIVKLELVNTDVVFRGAADVEADVTTTEHEYREHVSL